ncbi:hypothetical protein BDV98DRAFT_577052 [Pterulicium gracile]|uniref:Uncharacterized protein n=1 Tax=Pterulicium gracile TaxID=1884261 RepID=A0A5C3Q2X7_9AGAR|nr:hypothetical protein BDV98DRAFT_577052 [Pterula gracilis]
MTVGELLLAAQTLQREGVTGRGREVGAGLGCAVGSSDAFGRRVVILRGSLWAKARALPLFALADA